MEKNFNIGIVGATGMVGQRFITLLNEHPWFNIVSLAASPRSAGKTYEEAVGNRWAMKMPIPEKIKNMTVTNAFEIPKDVHFVFCAVDMPKDEIKALEETYAKAEIPVISNNSANRWTEDVPMVIPEVNPESLSLIELQRKRLGTKKGFIATKSNCSIQSYVPPLTPLLKYGIKNIVVSTYQAISGAGKTFETFPEILDNIIPYIGGEEEKSEKEPLKIWQRNDIAISAQCLRVPVTDGHTATVAFDLKEKVSAETILSEWEKFGRLDLPSAPEKFIVYFNEENRPQAKIDRDLGKGMAISVGRLRPDNIFDWKFVALSHNTLRGAAGGAVLLAELCVSKGYIY
ncbi:MAG: aspartate-semialdehyde dehydrogenase [Ruminococcus sp.]|jgi:aspartate-semialdehyde dehydrogenase|nr:aspartate-semialdehyde dehydrogenase [Ruminococcus sp.]